MIVGKLAEIKDMEEAVEPGTDEAKEFLEFTKRQQEHNLLVEKLMKIAVGCAAGVLAVVITVAVLLVPKVLTIVSKGNDTIAQAEDTMKQAQGLIVQIQEGNPKHLMEQIDALAKEGETALQESVEQLKKTVEIIEKIDIDALNKAVDNLGKAVSPLAKLFGGK